MDELKIVMYWSHGGEGQTTTPDGHTYVSGDGGVLDKGIDRDGNEHPVLEEHTAYLQDNGWTFSGDGKNQPPPVGTVQTTTGAAATPATTPTPATETSTADQTTAPEPTTTEPPVSDPGASVTPDNVPAGPRPEASSDATWGAEASTPASDVTAQAPMADATEAGAQAPDAGNEQGQQTIGTLSSAAETADPSTANPADMSTEAHNVVPDEAPASAAEETPNA